MTEVRLRRERNEELDEIAALATPLGDPADLDPLLERIGEARFVLLGEASHGTSEYYRWRAEVTRRLVDERAFSFVAVEGDWPDCFAVNRWVKGHADQERGARQVLGRFERWPTWMWANEEVAEFAEWLRGHNARTGGRVGFYGIDVYSLWESLRRIFTYLGERQPDALGAAVQAFRCFEPYAEDAEQYAWATLVPASCENEVVGLLCELHRTPLLGDDDPEAELDAPQNAEVLAGAERYYRTMGPRRRRVLERPRLPHGRHPRPARRPPRARRQGRRVGTQHPRRRRPRHRHGGGRDAQRRPARARAPRTRRRRARRLRRPPGQRDRG